MEENNGLQIVNAISIEQLDQVRNLMRGFVNWHRERHSQDMELIDKYFAYNAFEEELGSLPGKYAMPDGRLLLASYDGQPAGCVALHKLDSQTCEMKRMFVYNEFRGKGIGRMLAENVIKEARKIGYSSMKLDTSIRQTEAQRLYESLGFKRTGPYYNLTKELEDWLVFMELFL
jgi:ribosomal protein S18 acetylase RimI-like enzyme